MLAFLVSRYADMIMRDLVRVFKTLSDETRLRILNLLTMRECCVCEVMQALDISQSRASRNLSVLYNSGLLKLRREGTWALYSIDKDNLKEHYTEIIRSVEKALEGNEFAQADRKRLESARRVGPCCV